MFIVYTILAAAWGFQCWRNLQDLLPIQVSASLSLTRTLFLHSSKYYLSSLLGFLVIEMVANWGKQYSSLTVLFPDVSD